MINAPTPPQCNTGKATALRACKCFGGAFGLAAAFFLIIKLLSLLPYPTAIIQSATRAIEFVFSVGSLVFSTHPGWTSTISVVVLAGAICFAIKSPCGEPTAGEQKVFTIVEGLVWAALVCLAFSVLGFISATPDANFFLENNTWRAQRALLTPAQVKAAHAGGASAFFLDDDAPALSTQERARLIDNAYMLYEGQGGRGYSYANCQRMLTGYLEASKTVQQRMTLMVNGQKIVPGQATDGVCYKTRFNSYLVGYAESPAFLAGT